VDQFSADPEWALLSRLHAVGAVHASPGQRPHAAHVGARGGELSCRAPATARGAHAASVLSARKQANERIYR